MGYQELHKYKKVTRKATEEEQELIVRSIRDIEFDAIFRLFQYVGGIVIILVMLGVLFFAILNSWARVVSIAVLGVGGIFFTFVGLRNYVKSKRGIRKLYDGEYAVVNGYAQKCEAWSKECRVQGIVGEEDNCIKVCFGISNAFIEVANFDRTFLFVVAGDSSYVVAKLPNGDVLGTERR